MEIELSPRDVRHEGSFRLGTPLGLVQSLLNLGRLVLVLRDLPASVQDQTDAVVLHQRLVHDNLASGFLVGLVGRGHRSSRRTCGMTNGWTVQTCQRLHDVRSQDDNARFFS